ncbi:MAG: peptidoglycan DD-metalloendopeptidase family protein [Faecalibacterium sp.]
MDQLRKFLHGKGFALAMAACLLAAACAGVWAVRVLRDRLEENLEGLNGATEQDQTAQRMDEELLNDVETDEEAQTWQQQTEPAANSVANVPKPEPSASSGSLSGGQSGSGSVSEPSALRTDSAPASSSAAPASTRPVSGRVLNTYSGDDLVYNKTLGDWRTHNGVDLACSQGEDVSAPVSGKVTLAGQEGNWGTVVAIEDAQGRIWRLCGLQDLDVKQGDNVSAGQEIGEVGSVSCECAEESHIHLEVIKEDKYLDPIALLSGN